MFRFAFGNLSGYLEVQPAFLLVASKQAQHLVGMPRKIGQRLFDGPDQDRKFWEILVMRSPLFRLLPQVFDRIVIRRIRRQWMSRDPLAMGDERPRSKLRGIKNPKAENLKTVPIGLLGYATVYSPSPSLDSSHTGG